MYTKLTLRLEASLIKRAKSHARKLDKSLSQIVADYFALLNEADNKTPQALPPLTQSLKGALQGTGVDEKDYQHYIDEKYR